jgi:hypothetical protein
MISIADTLHREEKVSGAFLYEVRAEAIAISAGCAAVSVCTKLDSPFRLPLWLSERQRLGKRFRCRPTPVEAWLKE